MVQFLSIFFFLGFFQFLLGFSKVPVFFCVTLYYCTTDVVFYVTSTTGANSLLQPRQHAIGYVLYGMIFDELKGYF